MLLPLEAAGVPRLGEWFADEAVRQYLGCYGEFEHMVRGFTADPANAAWVTERRGEVEAVVLTEVSAYLRVTYVPLLLVHPARRGQGIGGRVLAELPALVRRIGPLSRSIDCFVSPENIAGTRLAKSAGYCLVQPPNSQQYGRWRREMGQRPLRAA